MTALQGAPLIRVEGLTKTFGWDQHRVEVLKGLDLIVDDGESLAIVGASGVGKSTLLHIMGGLDRPTSGTVLYKERDIFALNDRDLAGFRNRTVGFVFQFHNLLPEFSALENVMVPALIAGKRAQEGKEAAARVLGEVGLEARLIHRPGELSGGEQQRVAVARALVLDPPVLLTDEPTGNLDAKSGGAIGDLLVQLNLEKRITLIVVTHNLALAARMARRVALVDGKAEARP